MASGYFAGRMGRMFPDARLGRIHPANSFLTHEVVAKTALGIGRDEQPQWREDSGEDSLMAHTKCL